MTVSDLTAFLGWCSLVNYGLLLVSTVILVAFGGPVRRLHRLFFDLGDRDLTVIYVQSLAFFKVLVIVFNVVPFLVLYFAF
ncbi:DUF6868 family protein [Roseibium aestuarii]|uniref:DUF6868 family protein n=1 Tax=Roseibium aestuarii TaxID=2600299 RepID=A0ABW4JZL9_9HYPH|nr:hypothetical protein [Roseibium aestuarii]